MSLRSAASRPCRTLGVDEDIETKIDRKCFVLSEANDHIKDPRVAFFCRMSEAIVFAPNLGLIRSTRPIRN